GAEQYAEDWVVPPGRIQPVGESLVGSSDFSQSIACGRVSLHRGKYLSYFLIVQVSGSVGFWLRGRSVEVYPVRQMCRKRARINPNGNRKLPIRNRLAGVALFEQ